MPRYATLPSNLRFVVADLLRDARASYRHARELPHRAAELRYYAWKCKRDARRLAAATDRRCDRHGWPLALQEAAR